MKKLDQIDSEVAENTHQMHKNELSIEKLRNFVERQGSEIDDMEEEIEDVEKKTNRNTRILTLFILLIVGIFAIIYINGMNVHYQTGLHELNNEVF